MYVDPAGSSVVPNNSSPSADSLLLAIVAVIVVAVAMSFLVVIVISISIFMCFRQKLKKTKLAKQGR